MPTRRALLKNLAIAATGIGCCSTLAPGLLGAHAAAGGGRKRRIATIDIFPFTLPMKQMMRTAVGQPGADEVLVRLRTTDGVVGWGEASPFPPVTGDTQASAVVIGKDLAAVIRGRDPFELAKIAADMDVRVDGNPSIKAALEMALWDICGKLAGQPVCHLLGKYRDTCESDRTVYLDDPGPMAEKAKEIVAEGYQVVKVKVGQSPDMDVARLRAVRAAVGERIRIRIDANQGWTRDIAVHTLKRMAPLGIEFCEQPVVHWDWEGMRHVRQQSPIPIMADESVHTPSDTMECVRRSAPYLLNVKLMKCGGILRTMQIAAIAEAANLQCMLGSMSETRIALTAAAHVMAAQKCAVYADLDTFTEHKIDPVLGGMQVKNGMVTLPDAPGLGVDVDPAFLKTLHAA